MRYGSSLYKQPNFLKSVMCLLNNANFFETTPGVESGPLNPMQGKG